MALGLLLSQCFLADHQGLGLESSDMWSWVACLPWAIHSGLPRGWMVWTSVGEQWRPSLASSESGPSTHKALPREGRWSWRGVALSVTWTSCDLASHPQSWCCYLSRVSQSLLLGCGQMCVCAKWLSHVRLFVTPLTVACQAPCPWGFSRQEYWSGLPCPPAGDLSHPEIEPTSLASHMLPRVHTANEGSG